MQSLWTGMSGLTAASDWLDRIGDNVANESTVGFAADTGSFADEFTMQVKDGGTAPNEAERYTPGGWWGGSGVISTGDGHDFSQMPVQSTGNQMDLALQGPGFFVVKGTDGNFLTKAGDFQWSKQADGQFALALPNGMPVLDVNGQPIVQGTKPGTPAVGTDGTVQLPDGRTQKLAVVQVAAPDVNLSAVSDTLYQVKPGIQLGDSKGTQVIQGSLDMSNVDMTQEMTDMIQAQQFYQLNAQSVSDSNKMEGIVNNLRP